MALDLALAKATWFGGSPTKYGPRFANVVIRSAIHGKTRWIERRHIATQSQHSNIVSLFIDEESHSKWELIIAIE